MREDNFLDRITRKVATERDPDSSKHRRTNELRRSRNLTKAVPSEVRRSNRARNKQARRSRKTNN